MLDEGVWRGEGEGVVVDVRMGDSDPELSLSVVLENGTRRENCLWGFLELAGVPDGLPSRLLLLFFSSFTFTASSS